MFPPAIASLISLLINILILLIIVRAVFSFFPRMLYTEIGRILITATDWILVPVRRVIPPAGGIDFSPLIAILILYAVAAIVVSGDVVGALIGIVANVILLLVVLLLIRVLFGFFRLDPWNPIVQTIMRVSEPFARPFRAFLPQRRGQFDWAPVAAFVVLLAAYELVTHLRGFGLG